MSGPAISPRTRRYLSADALFALLRQRFETVQDPRKQSHLTFTLPDVLASGLAMFSLKDPSLLAYGERHDDPSLKNVFGIKSIPSDTQFREILDPIEVDALNEAFADVFAELQRGGVLEQFRFLGDGYLVAIDGTGLLQFVQCALRELPREEVKGRLHSLRSPGSCGGADSSQA